MSGTQGYSFTNDDGSQVYNIDADQMNSNFDYLQEDFLPINTSWSKTSDTYDLGSSTYKWQYLYLGGGGSNAADLPNALVPVGAIIPWYDYNSSLTIDGNYWKYCDGSAVTVGNIGVQTLPDLSNRYLVGFGTEAGGNIDTAGWSTTVVGNASHQINIQHSHDVDIATFSSDAGSSHSHGPGTLKFVTGYINTGKELWLYQNTGTSYKAIDSTGFSYESGLNNDYLPTITAADLTFTTQSGTGTSASEASHTHYINPPNKSSTNGLSTTQSIQPRSIKVRFIMRVK